MWFCAGLSFFALNAYQPALGSSPFINIGLGGKFSFNTRTVLLLFILDSSQGTGLNNFVITLKLQLIFIGFIQRKLRLLNKCVRYFSGLLGGIPGNILTIFLVKKFGRKRVIIIAHIFVSIFAIHIPTVSVGKFKLYSIWYDLLINYSYFIDY